MRNIAKAIYVLSFLVLLTTNSYAVDEHKVIADTIKANDFVEQHQAETWPGFHMNDYPMIVYFGNGHTYAQYLQPTNPDWQMLQKFMPATIYYLPTDEYQLHHINGVAYTKTIDGQPSYVFNYTSIKRDFIHYEFIMRALFHDRFHFYQMFMGKFPGKLVEQPPYSGFNDLENMKLAYLESEMLKSYLNNPDTEKLRQIVAVMRTRKKLLDNDSWQFEMHMENLEGLADYIAWTVMDMPSAERNKVITDNHDMRCPIDNVVICQTRFRYYFTGSVIGMILDQLSTPWKLIFINDLKSVREQLMDLVPMTKEEIEQELARAKQEYHYDELTAPVAEVVKKYQKERTFYQEQYKQSPGIVIRIIDYPLIALESTWEIEHLYDLANTWDSLYIGYTGSSVSSDGDIKIVFDKLPLKYSKVYKFRDEFKAEPTTQLIIDGQTLNLQDFYDQQRTQPFHTFIFKNDHVLIDIKDWPGTIGVKEGRVEIQFANAKLESLKRR